LWVFLQPGGLRIPACVRFPTAALSRRGPATRSDVGFEALGFKSGESKPRGLTARCRKWPPAPRQVLPEGLHAADDRRRLPGDLEAARRHALEVHLLAQGAGRHMHAACTRACMYRSVQYMYVHVCGVWYTTYSYVYVYVYEYVYVYVSVYVYVYVYVYVI
jgi:hypothetical protein